MVVNDNDLELFISCWREKLFSVQNTIMELLEGLDKLETEKIIQTQKAGNRSRDQVALVKEEQEVKEEDELMHDAGMGVSKPVGGETVDEEGWNGTPGMVEVRLKEDTKMDDVLPDQINHFLNPSVSSLQDCIELSGISSDNSRYFPNTQNTSESATERRYKCEICDFSTKVKFSLNRHMMTHLENQTQKSCDKCPYTTSRIDYMKRHMKKRHNFTFIPKPESSVDPRSSQNPHSNSGVDFDKYTCMHCRYITTRIGDLKKHMSEDHPKENKSVQLQTTQHANVIKIFK